MSSAASAPRALPLNFTCKGDACYAVQPDASSPAGTTIPAWSAEQLLGSSLLSANGPVPTSSLSGPSKLLALYFSAHWCPPCRRFTPALADIYKRFKATHARAADLEIVFVSSDRDEASFRQYYEEMPWLALPFEERELKAKLGSQFKVSGIPSLIILDAATGDTITSDGRAAIMEDPDCENFPWRPRPFSDLMLGAELINREGQSFRAEEALAGKVKLVYFSAHWCPPCRAFTPELAKTYAALRAAGKQFEAVFVSSDQGEEEFNEYLGEMPWLALSYADRKRKAQLASDFGVSGIPTLVILDEKDNVITLDGQEAIEADPEGAGFPFYPST